MAYDVSSSFIAESRKKNPTVVRKFTIANSDYSDRVLKWPSFSRQWDDIRPKTLQMKLANGDKGMNFMREDKTKMIGECLVLMGFDITDISKSVYMDKSWYLGSWEANPHFVAFPPDGSSVFVGGRSSSEIRSYPLNTPWDINDRIGHWGTINVYSETGALNLTGISFNDDGTKLFTIDSITRRLYEFALSNPYTMSPSSYTGVSYYVGSASLTPAGVSFKDDGTKFYVAEGTGNTVDEFYMTSAWDINTSSYSGNSIYANSDGALLLNDLTFSKDGTECYVACYLNLLPGIGQYELPTPWSVTSAFYTGRQLLTGSQDGQPSGICFGDNDSKFYMTGLISDTVYQYNVYPEIISLFSGETRGVKYSKEDCTLTIVDKFNQLSERQVGTSDVPVEYVDSNYLVSDIAWWAVTSYGGMSAIESTSNPDIDYEAFADWASVFSGDSVYMNGMFDGQKVTEILRKVSRNTHSGIFIKENKLSFHRFNLPDTAITSLAEDELINIDLAFRTDDIINRQYVSGDYDATSNYHKITVFDQSTYSVNSFGLKENTLKDDNLWYVDSASALNLSQRMISSSADPDDSLTVKAPLIGLPRLIGETITVNDNFHSITEAYRILTHKIDMDKGTTEFTIDRTQLVDGFLLDITSLDGTEVLT